MPLQTLNWGPTPGSQIATGLGAGLSQGMQALADMKMKEYAQRQQSAKNEAFFNTIPGMTPEKAKAFSNASPEMQQLGLKELLAAPGKESFNKGIIEVIKESLGQPSDPTKLAEIYGQVTPDQALKLAQFQQSIKATKAQEERAQSKVELAKTEQERKVASDLAPWIAKEDTASTQISDLKSLARNYSNILNEIGPKGYQGLVARGLGEATGGWLGLTPRMKELQALSGELALAKASSLKGQPTNFKVRLVQRIKPGLLQDYETNKRMVRRIQDLGEANDNRNAFKDSLQVKGQYPANIATVMSEYDAAMDAPEKHKKFFKQYPEAKDHAYFLSEEYEQKQMRQEHKEAKQMRDEKSPEASTSALKVGAVLDQLPAANSVPSGTVLTDKSKNESYMSDGANWRKV